jgi:hypothetical protein
VVVVVGVPVKCSTMEEEFEILQRTGCGRGLLNDGELAELEDCGTEDEADGAAVDS